MKKKAVFILAMLFLIGFTDFAQDTTTVTGTLSLKQCLDIAIRNNLLINQSAFASEGYKIAVQRAFGNMLPTAYVNVNHDLSDGRVINSANNGYITQALTYANYNLNVGLTLFNFGSIQNNLRANRFTYEASKMDLQQQKDVITINVILAYLQIVSNEEQLAAAQEQVEVAKKQVDRLELQNNEGALLLLNSLSDLKGSLASSQLAVLNLQNTLDNARISLVQLLNVPYTSSIDVQKMDTDMTPILYSDVPDAIYQQAMQNLALIKSAHLKTQSSISAVRAAWGQMLPTLSFGAGAGTNFSSAATDNLGNKIAYGTQLGNNFNSNYGIGIYIPILQNLSLRSQYRQAKVNENLAKFNEASTKTTLQQNIQQAYINMKTSFDSYQKSIDQVNGYKESFRIVEVKFNEGVLTSADYLLAKNNYDAAVINLINVKYTYALRTKVLDYYEGKLSLQ